jgi:diguanylate cyclase (GGDEF)-like protein/putative nucleotidyltransferase with HDIG domain
LILQHIENHLQDGIEKLLSVKSILGCPILFKNKVVGILILHQCDYERAWNSNNIELLRRVSNIIGLLFGSEIKTRESKNTENIDPNSGLVTSDAFLRELSHAQIGSQINNSSFSLILIDIEKLRDINISQGFVAGNLVLSQTGRYLKRLYDESAVLARYNNDEFVILLKNTDKEKAKIEVQRIKDALSNTNVLGVGTIDYNFSFITFPTHSDSISELLGLLEQGMILSKSRGKSQISSYDELMDQPKSNWKQLLTYAIPEIVLKKSNLKTGPEVFEKINKQISETDQRCNYSADILDSVQSLAIALDAKDSYTEGHSKRVSEYAYFLAKEIGLDLQQIEWIRLAAGLHDIGKIGIPESILCKPGKLTREEYDVMKKHPVIGAKILKPLKPLESVATLVLYHHEYWNGSGYPEGLSKQNIPIGSRIVSIVDAYQAMTSNRPYRSSLTFEEALRRLKDGKEKQWDPELIDIFIEIVSRDA